MGSSKPKALAWLAALSLCWLVPVRAARGAPPFTPSAPALAAAKAQHASILMVDLQTQRTTFLFGAPVHGLPGSVLKPLFLEYALTHGIVQANTTASCHRSLGIAGRPLTCTHPADRTVFIAETALADSCNTWFAQLGQRFTGAQIQSAYATFGLVSPPLPGLSVEERQLRVLGLAGAQLSPQQLARAYTMLLAHLSPGDPVFLGLRGSVRYGMAHPAAIDSMDLLGKTGTASNPGEFRTHGWFAGGLPGRLLIIAYVPNGDGGSAARLARMFLLSAPTPERPH